MLIIQTIQVRRINFKKMYFITAYFRGPCVGVEFSVNCFVSLLRLRLVLMLCLMLSLTLCCLLLLTGDFGYVCCVRDVRSEQCFGREQSLCVADTVQPSSLPHVHVPYACRCIRSGKKNLSLKIC